MVEVTFLRVVRLCRASSAKSKTWNFHPESDREPLKTFGKEGRKGRCRVDTSEARRGASGSEETPPESLKPGITSTVGVSEVGGA